MTAAPFPGRDITGGSTTSRNKVVSAKTILRSSVDTAALYVLFILFLVSFLPRRLYTGAFYLFCTYFAYTYILLTTKFFDANIKKISTSDHTPLTTAIINKYISHGMLSLLLEKWDIGTLREQGVKVAGAICCVVLEPEVVSLQ
ncbi:unnamed protein product [Clonostachys chloroleuca]|uniref:Uncharacterized protein n=1 Tax=Clonostachys chloroleuca TaxID=1926264 RepID=A0AA35LUS5_9HYPO|nr:unnamed protein product [Clonostachys chloroleuca]